MAPGLSVVCFVEYLIWGKVRLWVIIARSLTSFCLSPQPPFLLSPAPAVPAKRGGGQKVWGRSLRLIKNAGLTWIFHAILPVLTGWATTSFGLAVTFLWFAWEAASTLRSKATAEDGLPVLARPRLDRPAIVEPARLVLACTQARISYN